MKKNNSNNANHNGPGTPRSDFAKKKIQEKTERIRHLNAILRSIRGVNQLIVREKRRDRLIQAACEVLVRDRGFNGAWIVLTDRLPTSVEEAQKGFREEAFSGLVNMFRKGELPLCCRRAQRESRVIVTVDPTDDSAVCPLANAYRGMAALTTKLEYKGQLRGYMSISVPPQFAADEEERSLLEETAHDIAFALYGIDIENMRRESEEKFQVIANSALDAIILQDGDGSIVYWNTAAERIFGYSSDEVIGKNAHDLLVPERYRAQYEKGIETFKQTGAGTLINKVVELIAIRKNGSEFPVEIAITAIRIKEQYYASAIIRDITEHKRAEEVLRYTELEKQTIIDALPTRVILQDLDLSVIWANRAACESAGLPLNELFGKHCYEIWAQRNDICPDCPVAVAIKTGRVQEAVMTTPSGKTWQIKGCPVRDQAGQIVIAVGVTEDITERVSLEAQLRQSQKLESIGRLTGGIAHDFNNLLTSIIGNAEIAIMDMAKDEPFYDIMKEIKEAGKKAASLTHQLLAFSRKQIIQPEAMNLNDMVGETEKMLGRLIGEDIELEIDLSPDLGQIKADTGQMEQVLMNLAVNSKDAMPKGGKLTIETGNVELDKEYARNHIAVTPGPYVMLAMSDTGIGMTKEVQAQVFEPFFTTKEKGKGTGLGLSTVYGIVKQSNGNIWIYSEPGKGTTFKIYLPRVVETAPGREREKEKKDFLHGSETVLVVEDDETVRNMAIKVLKRFGYTVLCAPEGQEGLRICREYDGPIHLMLTDVIMPGMSGKELAEHLKTQKPGIRVLFMSGYTDNAIVHRGILDKGIAFLQKPFTPDGLARKLREVLDDPALSKA